MKDSEKLRAYEAMHENIIDRYNTASDKMIRLKAEGKEKRQRVEEDFREKRAEGGINELFFKRPDKRVAYETFGKPLAISFIAGFVVMLIIFYLF